MLLVQLCVQVDKNQDGMLNFEEFVQFLYKGNHTAAGAILTSEH